MQFTNAAMSERFGLRDWDDYYDGLAKLAADGMPIYFEDQIPTPAEGECLDVIVVERSGHVGRAKVLAGVELPDDFDLEITVSRGGESSTVHLATLPATDPDTRVIGRFDDAATIAQPAASVVFEYGATEDTAKAGVWIAGRLAAHLGMAGKLDLFMFPYPPSDYFAHWSTPVAERQPVAVKYLLAPSIGPAREV